MMRKIQLAALLLFLVLVSCNARISNKEEQEVLDCLNQMFDAMHRKDIPTLKELLMDNGQYHSINNQTGKITCKTFHGFITDLTNTELVFTEKLIHPEVKVNSNIAIIWSEYEFKVNHKRSHLGVELFSFIKINNKWKINSSTYTIH
jgi:PBP1b-binding outer membrane lipoprotein LpoB